MFFNCIFRVKFNLLPYRMSRKRECSRTSYEEHVWRKDAIRSKKIMEKQYSLLS